jgi:putative heme iron utilization protein
VKHTRGLVRDLEEDVKEVMLLGEHGEEASQKITQLEALCKRLREDAQELKEENTKLEGMIESRNKFIMEISRETGLDRMGEDVD